MASICLLAPVPEEHLVSGLVKCATVGKVAFGSRAWEVFRKLDELISPLSHCQAFLYVSYAQSNLRSPGVAWSATYVGHVNSVNGAHPSGMKYRPKSTASYLPDNQGHWAIFWEVADLKKLSENEYIKISEFIGYDQRRRYLRNYIPHGPVIVEMT